VSAHSVPLHCCYCGGENLFPHPPGDGSQRGTAPHGQWECRECLRVFSVTFVGLLAPPPRTGGAR